MDDSGEKSAPCRSVEWSGGTKGMSVTASDVEAKTQDAQVLTLAGGREIGFAEYGDPAGSPVLALHGAPACRLMFRVADQEAARLGLRLIAPDRPGYGLSPIDSEGTLKSRTDELIAFADALGWSRFAVLAVSGGGPYAVSLAAALKERVTALALVSPMGPIADYSQAPMGQEHPVDFFHRRFFMHLPYRTWLTHPGGDLMAWMFRHASDTVMGIVPKVAPRPDAAILSRPDAMELIRDMTLEAFRQGGAGGTRDLEIYGRPWGVAFGDVRAQTVIWQGLSDPIVPPQVTKYLAELLPRAEYRPIRGAGHFWVLDHLSEVLGVLRGLIDQGTAT